jgi:hypothetical protein
LIDSLGMCQAEYGHNDARAPSLRANCGRLPLPDMAALVAAIHALLAAKRDVDGRHKAGHVELLTGMR